MLYKQNICKTNYKYSIEQGFFKKWRRLMTICCLKKFQVILAMTKKERTSSDNEEMKKILKIDKEKKYVSSMGGPTCE